MTAIEVFYMGAKHSPWHQRLSKVAERNQCIILQQGDWSPASYQLAEASQATSPLLAIDQSTAMAIPQPIPPELQDLTRVLLCTPWEQPAFALPGEPNFTVSIPYEHEDSGIIFELLQAWYNNSQQQRQSTMGAVGADKIDNARQQLLATTVHDLRSPLAVVEAYCELGLLNALPKGATTKTVLGIIQKNIHLTLELIQKHLGDYRQNAASKVKPKPEPADFKADIISFLRHYQVLAERKGLSFEMECQESVPTALLLDRCLLLQIASNLILNAIKYTDHGGVKLIARYCNATQCLSLDIQDSGKGIPHEHQEQIFQLFFRGQCPPTTEDPLLNNDSVGMGLHNARRLARVMGGNVSLRSSELNRGSVFTIAVPAPAVSRIEPTTKSPEQILGADIICPSEQTDPLPGVLDL